MDPSPASTGVDPATARKKKEHNVAATQSQAADASGKALPESEPPQGTKKARKDPAAPKGLPTGIAPGVKPERKPKTMPPAASAKQLLVRTVALGNLSAETSAQALAYAQSVTEVRSKLPLT